MSVLVGILTTNFKLNKSSLVHKETVGVDVSCGACTPIQRFTTIIILLIIADN